MAAVTLVALLAAASFRFGSTAKVKSLTDRRACPALQLVDLDSSEPLLMLGLKGKVVWIVFWSAEAPKCATDPGRDRPRFEQAEVASEIQHSDGGRRNRQAVTASRTVISEAGVDLPVYLASSDSRLRFGAEQATCLSRC